MTTSPSLWDFVRSLVFFRRRIRTAAGENKVKTARGVVRKEISFGVAEYPVDATSFWQAIKFADVALYNAKETGRNKVVRFTKEMWKDEQY